MKNLRIIADVAVWIAVFFGGMVYGKQAVMNSAVTPQARTSNQETVLPAAQNTDFRYKDLFIQDAAPVWQVVHWNGMDLTIPYSPRWEVSTVGLLPYETEQPEPNHEILRFGRLVDEGTYFSREYFLTTEPVGKSIVDPMTTYASPGCDDGRGTPRKISVGKFQGIANYIGGAHGCTFAFTFTIGQTTYSLGHMRDLELDPYIDVDAEMKTILGSLGRNE